MQKINWAQVIVTTIIALTIAVSAQLFGEDIRRPFRSWRIGRSQRKLKKRLAEIATELARIDALTPVDRHDTLMDSIALILIMLFQLTVIAVVMVLSRSKLGFVFEFLNHDQVPWILMLLIFVMIITLVLKKVLLDLKLQKTSHRNSLLKEKANLESRLTQAGSS